MAMTTTATTMATIINSTAKMMKKTMNTTMTTTARMMNTKTIAGTRDKLIQGQHQNTNSYVSSPAVPFIIGGMERILPTNPMINAVPKIAKKAKAASLYT